ncbi:MAG: hypothetical protein JW745_06015 [Sedimentisphaerales bacterium]|nr:hypothetical protein [Sedimentisphaerales bacterium]
MADNRQNSGSTLAENNTGKRIRAGIKSRVCIELNDSVNDKNNINSCTASG